MKDDKTFDEFYAKLNNIVKTYFNLREKMKYSKVVHKILISLPKRFQPKITVIKENNIINEKKLDELVKNLHKYEINHHQDKKDNIMALVSKQVCISEVYLEVDYEVIANFVKKIIYNNS